MDMKVLFVIENNEHREKRTVGSEQRADRAAQWRIGAWRHSPQCISEKESNL
jgi:hypothetical protein